MRRHLRIDLAYDGTDFSGWQVQAKGRTVQGTLEAALFRLQGDRPVRVNGAGRTDAGAHARAQVADAFLETDLGLPELNYALLRMLPADLRAIRLREVPESFHARRDAVSKTYRYRLDRSNHGDPFLSRYALHHPYALDVVAMQEALLRLPGERDWSAFAGAKCKVKSRVRDLREASFQGEPKEDAYFSFTANGFLTHMVRNLVGTLLEVARGRTSPEQINRIVASRDRAQAGPTAPAHGLLLWEIRYPGE